MFSPFLKPAALTTILLLIAGVASGRVVNFDFALIPTTCRSPISSSGDSRTVSQSWSRQIWVRTSPMFGNGWAAASFANIWINRNAILW